MTFSCIKREVGKWSSPVGEVKLFTNPSSVLKCYGPTKKKIIIVTDNEELYIAEMLRNMLTRIAARITNMLR